MYIYVLYSYYIITYTFYTYVILIYTLIYISQVYDSASGPHPSTATATLPKPNKHSQPLPDISLVDEYSSASSSIQPSAFKDTDQITISSIDKSEELQRLLDLKTKKLVRIYIIICVRICIDI